MRFTHSALLLLSLLVLSVLAISVQRTEAVRGIDLSYFQGSVPQSAWNCIRSNGNSFVIIQGTKGNSGSVNPYVADDLKRAHAAGIPYVDIYVFLSFRRGSPAKQVSEVLDFIQARGLKFGMMWHDVEGPKYWGSCAANQNFMRAALAEGARRGVKQGIYSSASQWNPIMCNTREFGEYPLWYPQFCIDSATPYDRSPSFSDFRPFGGWSKPAIKQYQGTTNYCGTQVDLNFY